MEFIDYYSFLGIDPRSSQEQIVEAIREKRREVKGNLALERLVDNANSILTNPENKLGYNIERFVILGGEALSRAVVLQGGTVLGESQEVLIIHGVSNQPTGQAVEIDPKDYKIE